MVLGDVPNKLWKYAINYPSTSSIQVVFSNNNFFTTLGRGRYSNDAEVYVGDQNKRAELLTQGRLQ